MARALQRDFATEAAPFRDKHASAFEVLFEERSRRMLQSYKQLPSLAEARPEREALCLRCHVDPAYDVHTTDRSGAGRRLRLEDGVSCETCHGPAQHWLAEHFRPAWRELSVTAKAERGMRDLSAPLGRVQACLGCHVGSEHADVDHDLIAAGHPWLRFDFADHHERWHKHWHIATDPVVLDAGTKALGAAASAQASLRLLAARAADARRVWPEFAAYDCAGCHQHLSRAGFDCPCAAGPWQAALEPLVCRETARCTGASRR